MAAPGRDWSPVEESDEFRDLVATRRRFTLPALIAFAVVFGTFLVLSAYARDFMAQKAIGSVTWAWVIAVVVILLTVLLTVLYGRFADRDLAPKADAAGEVARRDGEGP